MLKTNTTSYPLCLLDTCAVSDIVKDPDRYLPMYYDWARTVDPPFVPCISPYSLFELRRQPQLFREFVQRFEYVTWVMLKGYAWFIEDEVAAYTNRSPIDPCAIAFTFLGDEGNLISNLPYMLDQQLEREREWNDAEAEIVAGMVSLVPNYPPSGTNYTTEEIRHFVSVTTFQLLAEHDKPFVQREVDADRAVDMEAFPSLKAMSYTVFEKFYSDRGRRSQRSDGFDVLIASALPYVEAVITERHQAQALRKIQRRHDFLPTLQVIRFVDFRLDQAR